MDNKNYKLNEGLDIKVEGRTNSWYIIAIGRVFATGKIYYLLENNTYGDETANIIVEEPLNIWKMQGTKPNGTKTKEYYYVPEKYEVGETFDPLDSALIDECIIYNENELEYLDE